MVWSVMRQVDPLLSVFHGKQYWFKCFSRNETKGKNAIRCVTRTTICRGKRGIVRSASTDQYFLLEFISLHTDTHWQRYSSTAPGVSASERLLQSNCLWTVGLQKTWNSHDFRPWSVWGWSDSAIFKNPPGRIEGRQSDPLTSGRSHLDGFSKQTLSKSSRAKSSPVAVYNCALVKQSHTQSHRGWHTPCSGKKKTMNENYSGDSALIQNKTNTLKMKCTNVEQRKSGRSYTKRHVPTAALKKRFYAPTFLQGWRRREVLLSVSCYRAKTPCTLQSC